MLFLTINSIYKIILPTITVVQNGFSMSHHEKNTIASNKMLRLFFSTFRQIKTTYLGNTELWWILLSINQSGWMIWLNFRSLFPLYSHSLSKSHIKNFSTYYKKRKKNIRWHRLTQKWFWRKSFLNLFRRKTCYVRDPSLFFQFFFF